MLKISTKILMFVFVIVFFIFLNIDATLALGPHQCISPSTCGPNAICKPTAVGVVNLHVCLKKSDVKCTKNDECKQTTGDHYQCKDSLCYLDHTSYDAYLKEKGSVGKCDKTFDGKCYYNMGQMTEAECKKKKEDADTANIGQYKFISVDKTCYFDEKALNRYNSNENKDDLITPPKISPPVVRIKIPGLDFAALSSTLDAQGYLNIPWISQYIAAAYKFAMVAASIIAILMIMLQGFKILAGMGWIDSKNSEGGKEKVAVAWKKIGQVAIGLSLIWGSYTILYFINPNLVKFTSLRIKYINTLTIEEVMKNVRQAEASGGSYTTRGAKVCHDKESCIKLCATPEKDRPTFSEGMAKPDEVKPVLKTPGIVSYGVQVKPELIQAIARVGVAAEKRGYKIGVNSGYRPLKDQIAIACKNVKAGSFEKLGKVAAWPGGSPHGSGIAIDVQLIKNGARIWNSITDEQVNELEEIMREGGFYRYCFEFWHFEIGTAGTDWRPKANEYCPRPFSKKRNTKPAK